MTVGMRPGLHTRESFPVRHVLLRLGRLYMLSALVIVLLPLAVVLPAEGLWQTWVVNREAGIAVFAALAVGAAGLTLNMLAAGGRDTLVGGFGALMAISFSAAAFAPPQANPAPRYAITYGWLVVGSLIAVGSAALIRRTVPGAVTDRYLRLDAAAGRRIGVAAVLLAALWVAAVRVGLPYRLRVPVDVDVAVWGAVALAWVAFLAAVWPLILRTRPRGAATEPIDVTRGPVGRATRRAEPTAVEPAQLSDLVLPDATLGDLRTLIRLIADPEAGKTLGVGLPQGALLYGPPGTGKTLIARALAGECQRQVLAFNGASLTSMWMGESTQLVRDMFDQGKEKAPCVLFIDELDGIAPARSGGADASGAARDRNTMINEFLQHLEGVAGPLTGVFVVGATNHLDTLDPAIRSRLAYHIAIPLPDEPARAAILRRTFPANTVVAPEEIAHMTQGMSGRDLRELCRAASIAAFSARAEAVTRAHFDAALARVGSEPAAHATRAAEPSRVEPAAFADLVLPEPTMAELRMFVRLLRDPDRGRDFGAEAPQGAVLYGPPGTGKTLIARAVAGELGRPVLAFSGASLTSMMAGEGSQLIRDAFAQVRTQAPCVMFIDEIEGVTPSRRPGAFGLGTSHDATQQINQFLQEIEGVSGGLKGVCIIGATNHLEAIDEAVLSRLSYHIEIPLPDRDARVELLRRHFPKRAALRPEDLTDLTNGLSGRDLRELCKTAGMIAVGEEAEAVTVEHFRRARERIGITTT